MKEITLKSLGPSFAYRCLLFVAAVSMLCLTLTATSQETPSTDEAAPAPAAASGDEAGEQRASEDTMKLAATISQQTCWVVA